MKKIISFLLITVFIGSVGQAQAIFDRETIKELMDRTNNYQFNHPWREYDDNWIRGTYYAGLMACLLATQDEAYL